MKFGLHLPQLGRAASPQRIIDVEQRAEMLGFDDLWVSDHVAVPLDFEGIPAFFLEPIPLLALAAAVTERVGLGTSIIVPAYRNPMHLPSSGQPSIGPHPEGDLGCRCRLARARIRCDGGADGRSWRPSR